MAMCYSGGNTWFRLGFLAKGGEMEKWRNGHLDLIILPGQLFFKMAIDRL
jgi:hypothetical protein